VARVTRRRRSGRPYQPYPARSSAWVARLLVVLVGVAMVIGALAFAFVR